MTQDEPRRPDPEALLHEVGRTGRGRLKVFLGMSPGVGKTFDMLREARRRKAEGLDVVVGIVETHGRRETEALLRKLEVLPRQELDYKGRTLTEFDLDAALARKPDLLLVDEYAHSNAPGSRHPKRWQDVEELLKAGIDVWTTLNVQHLESLVDVVWKITGVRQRETVPDSALSAADDIELVDITPAELRQRLAEGKVYLADTAKLAAEKFFKPENLTALRELALRRAAQTVDDQLLGAMKRAGVEGPWAAGERILVLIGGAPVANALVREGRRLSDMMMNAPWTVAHIDRPNRPPDAVSAARTNEALKLAQQLGAQTAVLSGDDMVETVLDHVRRNNVTQIVLGRTPRRRLRALFGRSLPQALLERSGGAALHIVTETAADAQAAAQPRPVRTARPWLGYLGAVALVAVATGVSTLADRLSNQTANLSMIYLVSVLATALAFGFGPAILAATLAALTYNFFFLEPRLTFYIGHAADFLTFMVFFVVAVAIGWLTGRVRDQAKATARRASAVTSLLEASRSLSAAARKADASQALAVQLAAASGGRAVILLPDGADIAPAAASPQIDALTPGEMAAARWAWEKGEPAGAGTGTLPTVAWTFRPLQGLKARSGVAGIEAGAGSEADERFILALLDQGAVAIERAEFAAEAADAEALRRSERLRSALLNSISHDLRTPLSTVLGSATTLLDLGDKIQKPVRRDLLVSIREEAERLNRYVGDLLDMTRLEGGGLAPKSDLIDVRDVLSAAVGQVSRRLGRRELDKDYAAELSMVKADPRLLEQAVVNILENAIDYSADGSRIEAAVYEDPDDVVISIEDQGRGIPKADLDKVFDKFRRLDEPTDRGGKGVGLGLSIAKGFVEAMGGRIVAVSPVTQKGGTRLLISLPKTIRTHEFLL